MTATELYIDKLTKLKEGDLGILRKHSGVPLDESLQGFDLFTGIWWPLRNINPSTPRRNVAWLIAKLYAAYPIPNIQSESNTFASILGGLQPNELNEKTRYRSRFDELLQTPLENLEYHLQWGLPFIRDDVKNHKTSGLNWVQLTNDLSIWDRGTGHKRKKQIQVIWAETFLNINESNY